MNRSAPLARRTPLARVSLLRRSKAKVQTRIPKIVQLEVAERSSGRCIVCARSWGNGVRLERHHILPQSLFPGLALVAENLVLACVACHANHTSRFRPIPRECLPACSVALALEHSAQATAYLHRTYPREAA